MNAEMNQFLWWALTLSAAGSLALVTVGGMVCAWIYAEKVLR